MGIREKRKKGRERDGKRRWRCGRRDIERGEMRGGTLISVLLINEKFNYKKNLCYIRSTNHILNFLIIRKITQKCKIQVFSGV